MAQNLSDYWRIDKSDDRTSELSSILSGAANVVELLDGKYGVQWVGKAFISNSSKLIGLNADILEGFNPPIPGKVVDVIIGTAIHETGHNKWSAPVENCSIWPTLYLKDRRELTSIYNIFEDAYIDQRLKEKSNTLAEYVKIARRVAHPLKKGQRFSLPDEELSRGILIEAWLAIYFYEMDMSRNISTEASRALAYLKDKTLEYIREDNAGKRLEMAVAVWGWLQQFPLKKVKGSLAYIDFKSLMGAHLGEGEKVADEDHIAQQLRDNIKGGSGQGTLQDLCSYLTKPPRDKTVVEKLKEQPEPRVKDITFQLSRIGVSGCVTQIKNAFYDAPSSVKVKGMVVGEIKSVRQVFARLDSLRTRWRHGLRDGKIDGGRLSKAGVGKNTVFKQCDTRRKPSLAVVFLIDVSSSMSPYMTHVNKAACIFTEALRPLYPRVWHEIITYTGEGLHAGSDVQLTRLASSTMKLSLRDIWMDGGTPTAEAIASALLMIKERSNKRKIIIHFTDGYPKDVNKTKVALSQCKKHNVDVITISMDIKQTGLYGKGMVEAISEVPELPRAVTKMLEKVYR